MVLFYGVLVMMFVAWVLAAVLAWRIGHSQPASHGRVDVSPWWSRGPHFWVYHFASPSKLTALGGLDRTLAILSIVLLSASLLLMGFGLFELARHGSL
jgi:hypothetical protein